MQQSRKILLAFYGDDFTGSTDALEFLARAGARTVLFLDHPTEAQLARYDGLDAVGVAGMTRTMGPADMAETLRDAFGVLGQLRPRHLHYKVCSTFDSSPEVGNIGTAISVGAEAFPNRLIPVLVGAPGLGRYSAFGNLFARMGIGSEGAIYRLDRHPSMSRHPVTPAHESDLRVHLSRQIDRAMGLIDLTDLEKPIDEIQEKLDTEVMAGRDIIFFDVMHEHQMTTIGQVLDRQVHVDAPLFSVGSSGIEKALGDYWTDHKQLTTRIEWEALSDCGPMLVLSGSCSPVTGDQISWALEHGFKEVVVDITLTGDIESSISEYAFKIKTFLHQGKSVILHTCKGPDDGRVRKTKRFFANNERMNEGSITTRIAKTFGKILGQAARLALSEQPVRRLVIAGGDTSGYVARELGIEAVEMIAPVYTGAPMCRAYAPGSPVDQLEVNLKGGQVGNESYFVAVQKGKI